MFLQNKILKTIYSPINGKIEVVKSLAFGTYITIGGLTQSGGIVYEIWKKTLKKMKNQKIEKCLILGLGGGSVSKIVNKYWPNAKISGVELDKEMVNFGKDYLDLKNVETKIEDAYKFCKEETKSNNKYDLIIVDLYLGDKFPGKFETDEFINLIKKLLTEDGKVIFNRLYYDRKRKEALIFGKKLEKFFDNVKYFYPEANLMLICY